MKVFISWSGATSHKVAVILRDWLPSVIQSIEPYVSSEDIDKGTRWATDIASELHASSYGLVCVTPDNVKAPWINFEAGALGKSIDKSRVSPFLFRIKRSEVEGPILQFQSTIFEKADVLKLLKSMNFASEQDALDETRLEKAFDVWWPELEKLLNNIPEAQPEDKKVAAKDDAKSQKDLNSRVLEELLELTRNNHKILRDPSSLLPAEYVDQVLNRKSIQSRERTAMREYESKFDSDVIRDLTTRYQEIRKYIEENQLSLAEMPEYVKLFTLIDRMHSSIIYLGNKVRARIAVVSPKGELEF